MLFLLVAAGSSSPPWLWLPILCSAFFPPSHLTRRCSCVSWPRPCILRLPSHTLVARVTFSDQTILLAAGCSNLSAFARAAPALLAIATSTSIARQLELLQLRIDILRHALRMQSISSRDLELENSNRSRGTDDRPGGLRGARAMIMIAGSRLATMATRNPPTE